MPDANRPPQLWLLGVGLIAAVVLAYVPLWQAGFIWDDDAHLTNNPCIIGPLGLKEIWTTSAARYYPLVLTTFWIEHALWGLAPLPYHLVNIALHGICAVLLWQVLRRLALPGAWLGAALWALHPVQVDTVAWVSELKNTQSCLFYLLSISCFLEWLKAGSSAHQIWSYRLTLLFAALAMASKSSTVVLPLVLGLGAWWIDRRWDWSRFKWILPVFIMSIVAAVMATSSVEIYGDIHNPLWTLTWPTRVIVAGKVFWFYLGKLVWPHPLIFIYPRWAIDPANASSYIPLLAALALMTTLWLKRAAWRGLFFALAYFLVALLPVLGLVEHKFLRYSFVADHLQYLASMGPLAFAGAVLTQLAEKIVAVAGWIRLTAAVLLLGVLGLLTSQRSWAYQSDEILWADTLRQNPDCWVAHANLGTDLLNRGQFHQAIPHLQRSIELNPHNAECLDGLGYALAQDGRPEEGLVEFKKALEIWPGFTDVVNPDMADADLKLGAACLKTGDVKAALVHLQEAVRLDPTNSDAQKMLAQLMARTTQPDGGTK